jgi:protein-S-isoprenylcysteine O-methyltransferase Ste14|tara:strand:+ start:4086 stop:4706 length:621 start_codon:yes stop_codon:yes gene_type:complete
MKQKFYIDTHKGLTSIYVLSLVFLFSAWENTNIFIYLALHGSYGILWILKSYIYPDRQWESTCSIWYGLFIWMGLSLYWISPYIIITQNINPPNWYLAVCIMIYIIGIFLHFTSDMQKFTQLKYKPNILIKNIMFSRIRNMNYLGELLIYLGFSLLAMHWIPILVLFIFIIIIWIPNMIKKDKSLSRYNDFDDYKKNSYSFLPYLW